MDRSAIDQLEPLTHLLALKPHQFEQADLRDSVSIASAGHDQRRDDGQRKGNLHPYSRALPGFGLQVDRATDLFDVRLDHIHPNAAAGDVSYFFCRGEAREKNEVRNLTLRHPGRLVRGDQSLLNGLTAELFIIEPGPIIRNFDVDLASFVKSP